MTTVNSSFWRDNNRVPITTDGIMITDTQSFTTTGTVAVPIFHVIGSVEIRGLWGIVTTALGNHTAAYFRLNDQTVQTAITKIVGAPTLTSAPVGSLIMKDNLASSTALQYHSAAAGVFDEEGSQLPIFQSFHVDQKTGGITTDIEYVYTTSDNPATGAIEFFVRFIPLSEDGNLIAI